MVWRGQTNPEDRLLACLPYLLPMAAAVIFGGFIFQQIPVLGTIFYPLLLLAPFAGGFYGLILFFMLYMLVVRNTRIKHFIRFNTMQGLLLDLGLSIILLAFQLLAPGLSLTGGGVANFFISTLFSTIFLGVTLVTIYCWALNILGKYPEVPILSEAAYFHTRY